jgi:hypothetical protein
VFFRHVPAGGDPLFRPERPADGRWQRGEVVEGFYLAADERTAWAEWYRALAELAVPPMRQMPRDLWRFEVELEGVADLSDAGKLEAASLPYPVPSRNQRPRFQAVGEALAASCWTGSSTLLRRDRRAELPCVYPGGIGTWRASIPSLRTPDTRSPQRPLVVLGSKEFRMCGRTKRSSLKPGFRGSKPAYSNTSGPKKLSGPQHSPDLPYSPRPVFQTTFVPGCVEAVSGELRWYAQEQTGGLEPFTPAPATSTQSVVAERCTGLRISHTARRDVLMEYGGDQVM